MVDGLRPFGSIRVPFPHPTVGTDPVAPPLVPAQRERWPQGLALDLRIWELSGCDSQRIDYSGHPGLSRVKQGGWLSGWPPLCWGARRIILLPFFPADYFASAPFFDALPHPDVRPFGPAGDARTTLLRFARVTRAWENTQASFIVAAFSFCAWSARAAFHFVLLCYGVVPSSTRSRRAQAATP